MRGQKSMSDMRSPKGVETWGRNVEVLEAVGLSLLGSAFPLLPMEDGRREASEKLWGRCGPELRAPRLFLSGACWGTSQINKRPAIGSRALERPVIGSASPGRLVIGSRALTRGRSLALGFPSVGPTCTRWLKFVGGEMSLKRTKGSFSISLQAERV